jgi:hypothetical protein
LRLVDAYIISLLASEALMIFPALNWWPHPLKSFHKLNTTDKFTFAVATFTAVLSIATCIQVWAFIQTERAFLIFVNPRFDGGLAPNKPVTLVATVLNSGRSVGFIDDLTININFKLQNERLPAEPSYLKGGGVAPQQVPPGQGSTVHEVFNGFNNAPQLLLTEGQIEGIKNGTTQLHIYGLISYTDEFSLFGSRKIGFCYLYDIRLGGELSSCTEPAYIYVR